MGQAGFEAGPLDRVGAAVRPPEQAVVLQHLQIPADRLDGHVEFLRQISATAMCPVPRAWARICRRRSSPCLAFTAANPLSWPPGEAPGAHAWPDRCVTHHTACAGDCIDVSGPKM